MIYPLAKSLSPQHLSPEPMAVDAPSSSTSSLSELYFDANMGDVNEPAQASRPFIGNWFEGADKVAQASYGAGSSNLNRPPAEMGKLLPAGIEKPPRPQERALWNGADPDASPLSPQHIEMAKQLLRNDPTGRSRAIKPQLPASPPHQMRQLTSLAEINRLWKMTEEIIADQKRLLPSLTNDELQQKCNALNGVLQDAANNPKSLYETIRNAFLIELIEMTRIEASNRGLILTDEGAVPVELFSEPYRR
jgi:hypothetical protein